jgi:AAA family ATP:ADP antiporter
MMIAKSEKGGLEKLLSVISDVRPGESLGALLLTLDLALLLGAYYLLKTVRESLILAESGAEVKAYSSAAQAIVLLGVVPLYGWIATHLNRNRLVRWTTLFFASNLIVFYFFGRVGVREGVVYYIWVGIFNVFIVAQLWAFAADLFTEDQGKRLFPILGIGASVGAVGGAWAAGKLIGPFGPYNLMLFSAFALCVCALTSQLASYVITKRQGESQKQKNTEPLGREGGFQLILSDPYLRLIAILTILLNIVIGSGDFIFGKLLVAHANEAVGTAAAVLNARKAYIGAFYANYYGWINLISFLIQGFLVSRIFKRIGVRASLFVLPALSLATFLSILAYPVLGVVRVLKIGENSANYSLQNTVRQALLLPTSREAKYKANAAIDTFCVRLGDVLQAAVIFVGSTLHFDVRSFAAVSLVMTVVWIFVAIRLYQQPEHSNRSPEFRGSLGHPAVLQGHASSVSEGPVQ